MNLSKIQSFLAQNTKILVPIVVIALAGILVVYFTSDTERTQIIRQEDHEPKTAITFKSNISPAMELSGMSKRKQEPESKSLLDTVDNYLPVKFRSKKESNQSEEKDEHALETLHAAADDIDENPGLIVAPFGRLLTCETVLTIDSSNTETPIIGVLTEDFWYDGRLIIPAGTEVHGSARAVKNRDRMVTDSEWKLIWVTKDLNNGMELPLKAIALDKDKNDLDGTWSMVDGTAGLKGTLLKADELSEMKLFGATFLGGVIAAIQNPGATASEAENSNMVKASFSNSVSQGVSAVIERYAETVMESIEKEGFFVRITAGKQFYLYVQQPIDLSLIHKMK
jgi:hypothetical protein